MQFGFGKGKPPLGIIYDSDMGDDIDAALALALAFAFDGKREARVVSLSTTKTNLKSAEFLDSVARFYASGVTGPLAEFFKNRFAIGMSDLGGLKNDTAILDAVAGHPEFSTSVKKFNDTAEPHALIRNALTAQYDGNAVVVLAGPATNLVRTLGLKGARDVAAAKAKFLVVTTTSLKGDIPAARQLFTEWPTPIIGVGPEMDAALQYPASSIDKDFAYSTAHPIVAAYKAYKPMPYDAPAGDMAGMLYAVRPNEGYFKLSDPGVFSIGDDGRVTFTASAGGKHKQLIFDPAQKEKVVRTFVELASAKPVVRELKFPTKKAQDDKKDEDKKDEKDEEKKDDPKKPEAPPTK